MIVSVNGGISIHLSFLFFYSTNIITTLLYIIIGDNMRKKFRTKKKIRHKHLLFITLLLFIIAMFSYIENNVTITLKNPKIIDTILTSSNKYSYEGVKNTYLSQEVYDYLRNNVFNSPTNLLKNQLNYEEETKGMISFSYGENTIPIIYIYNSHQGETYSTQYLEEYNIVPDVLMASKMLKDKLDSIGIPTLVEESDILKYMKENNLNHAGSYIASKHYLTKTLKKYPNMKLYIDLHRDAATHKTTITTINGKECAKVLFVIGLENENYQNNLNVVTRINNIILDKYPTLTRGILKKQGYGVNGVYNQDLNSNIILIEIGSNENNIEEVNNTLDLIAEVIGEYINEKEEK